MGSLEQRYQVLFERNPDGVFSVDDQGKFVIVNPACERLSGYSSEELLGKYFAELCAPEYLARTVEAFQRFLNEPGYSELETVLLRKDGSRVELWIAGEPVIENGKTVAVHCTAKDITQRNRFNAELERLVGERTAALEEATDQLNVFVYALAHDFKAPLRAQSGFAHALLEDFGETLGPEGSRLAGRIIEAAEKQKLLVNDLLHQVSLTREDWPIEPVNFPKLIIHTVEDFSLEIKEKSASVHIGKLQPTVLANPTCLHLVVSNLLSNALKFVTPGTSPTINIWSEVKNGQPDNQGLPSTANGRASIRLCIEDNGIGIHDEDKPRLFQAFQRLNSQSLYPGTGIGLAIAKKASERFGARLGVESEPGKGSRFWLELPQAD